MSLKGEKLLYLPSALLSLILVAGFSLIYVYTLDTHTDIYRLILKESAFYDSFFYGFKISLFSITTSLVVFLMLFYLLFMLKFDYSADIKNWLFFLHIPILIPYAFCAFLMFMIFFPRLIGTDHIVVITYTYKIVPFLILISFPTLLNITKDEINLHKINSNNTNHFFWNILIRRVYKTLFIGLFVVFAYVFNAYEIPFVLGSHIDKMPALFVNEKLGMFEMNSTRVAYASGLIYFLINTVFVFFFYIVYKVSKKAMF